MQYYKISFGNYINLKKSPLEPWMVTVLEKVTSNKWEINKYLYLPILEYRKSFDKKQINKIRFLQ